MKTAYQETDKGPSCPAEVVADCRETGHFINASHVRFQYMVCVHISADNNNFSRPMVEDGKTNQCVSLD